MRVDKFLKQSRIIKRRSIAKSISDLGFVKINNKEAKPSSLIKEGDVIELTLLERVLTIKVLTTSFSTRKEDANNSYEIISDERKSIN